MITRRRRTTSTGKEETDWSHNNLQQQGFQGRTSEITTDISSDFLFDSDDLNMSCRDRTVEFSSAVKSLKSRQNGVVPHNMASSRQNGIRQQASQFTIMAKQIGRDISNTFAKLEKLTILAKRKSLFDDKPVEIQELTYIIKKDITNLNKQIADLQQVVSSRKAANSKHVQTHSHTVVMSLQSKLAHMSKDFKNVLEVRTENMKQQKQRRDQFSNGPIADSLPSAAMNGGSVLHRLPPQPHPISNGGDSVAIDMSFGGSQSHDQTQPLMNSHQSMQLIEEQDKYIETRATAMESIEQTIVELGGIFQSLAHMVKEQEEQIQRIDANVEDTEMNVEAAHAEILKYFQSITSNRWLIIKIFFVLIIFFIVFVVLMA